MIFSLLILLARSVLCSKKITKIFRPSLILFLLILRKYISTALLVILRPCFRLSRVTLIKDFYNRIKVIKPGRCMPEGNEPLHSLSWINMDICKKQIVRYPRLTHSATLHLSRVREYRNELVVGIRRCCSRKSHIK